MKPTLLTALSFLLFALTSYLPLVFTQDGEPVKETDGNIVVPGKAYYMLPAIIEAVGGGITLGKTENSTCPLTVLQEFSLLNKGLPIKFSTPDQTNTSLIIEGITPVDISFVDKPECAESSKLVLVQDDDSPYKNWFAISGKDDHQGKHIIDDGKFKFFKQPIGYGLKSTYNQGCLDADEVYIGFWDDDEKERRLSSQCLLPAGPYEAYYFQWADRKLLL